ncbi:MAG TPA: UTP--glucose-1-phosphate uridylyltransferase GalU [Thermoanaerobaculaceae bacterium]|nr:UTP--glucose-1-phosphate uridylyltransferase GalU [Thermoanaerobaculaceae bacterium]HQU33320.1 UTP--glucose-1-phosphate uridylyltransferase GalU [Thermoanaerobaculaceae bacterium]
MNLRRAVFPVAGYGTRFLPASKAIPKELLPIVDKPAVQYVVEEAVAAGVETAIFVTAEGKSAIEDHFDRNLRLETFLAERGKRDLLDVVRQVGAMVQVVAVRQKEALGLGHAVLQAAPVLGDEPFAVLLGDDIIVGQPPAIGRLAELALETGAPVIAVMEVSAAEISHYGCIAGEEVSAGVWRVRDLVEKPDPAQAPSNLAIIGRYVLTPAVLRALAATPPDRGGEIQLTEGLRRTLATGPVYACTFPGKRYDAGNKADFLRATVEIALDHPELGAGFRRMLEDLLVKAEKT